MSWHESSVQQLNGGTASPVPVVTSTESSRGPDISPDACVSNEARAELDVDAVARGSSTQTGTTVILLQYNIDIGLNSAYAIVNS